MITQAGRMAGGVHRQRGHELGEAVEHEARAVVERRQRRQVLVLALAALEDGERAVEVAAVAGGEEDDPQDERERRRAPPRTRAAWPSAAAGRARLRAAKHGTASSSQSVAFGPQAPMNGGCGTPSCRPSRPRRARRRPSPRRAGRDDRHCVPSASGRRRAHRPDLKVPGPLSSRGAPTRALAAVLLAGCGSMAEADLPDPAGPPVAAEHGRRARRSSPSAATSSPRSGWRGETRLAVLCGRERVVEIYDTSTRQAGRRPSPRASGRPRW